MTTPTETTRRTGKTGEDLPVFVRPKRTWKDWPIISQVLGSAGLQRGMLVAGLILVSIFILTAVLAPWIAPFTHAQSHSGDISFQPQQAPGGTHLWGTTVGSYDVFSRVVWGTQTALITVVMAIAFSLIVGVLIGLFSGYFGGWVDRVLVVVADAIYAFPSLLMAIVLAIAINGGKSSFWGGIFATAGSITVVFVPQYFRVVRSEVLRLKAEPFVESARVIGVPVGRILFRHILRNSTRSLPLILTLNASEAILTLAGLGFLGFGIEPSAAAEWGYDLNRAMADAASGIWWTGLFPGLAIVLLVLGITLVGESLNDLADPRLRIHRVRKASPPSAADDAAAAAAASTEDMDAPRAENAGDTPAIDPASTSRTKSRHAHRPRGRKGRGKGEKIRLIDIPDATEIGRQIFEDSSREPVIMPATRPWDRQEVGYGYVPGFTDPFAMDDDTQSPPVKAVTEGHGTLAAAHRGELLPPRTSASATSNAQTGPTCPVPTADEQAPSADSPEPAGPTPTSPEETR